MPGKSHGQRSLVGYSPWGLKESDRLSEFTFTFTFILLSVCVKKSKSPTQALGWAVTWVGDGKEEILCWRDTESFWDIVVSSLSCVPTLLQPHRLQPTRLFCPWNFPGKDTGVSCHFILQGIFPTQGSNPHLLHGQANSLQPSHQGSPSEILAIFYFNPKGGYYMNSHLIILL